MTLSKTRTPEAIRRSYRRSRAVFVRCRRADIMTMYLFWRRQPRTKTGLNLTSDTNKTPPLRQSGQKIMG
ncbi:hypothetical protein ANN_09809 [Periplaneta americana]|uniref:Uncharacterized protein n=1 Tax=Periplaneta americana TaxID=6978 RepID=A0ABQ8TNT7_PERAM|nr:hypothetical protein ANN_09809 [Periplaneta americana]